MGKIRETTNSFGLIVKRIFDFLASLCGLVMLSPLFLLIAGLIKRESLGPVFFLQERVGEEGTIFKIYKFRSMVNNAEQIGLKLLTSCDDPRVTRVGKFLREYHLDELPQLFNVLKGDMSLIGPRPTLPHQVNQYTEEQKQRHTRRPGITGLAQVSGNNELDWDQRIKLDIEYIESWDLLLDIKILIKTINTVVGRRGLYGRDGLVHDE